MKRRAEMAAKAYREALRLRSRTGRAANVPLCPFDLADQIGVEVRFADIPSLEAVYIEDGEPKILVAADRPPGRQRFSCAHELGHHVFGHGAHLAAIDFSLSERRGLTDEEFSAQAFAGYLLLPKAAVSHAFAVRKWSPRAGIPEEYYTIAGVLGVSFEGLVTHCEIGLRVLAKKDAAALRAVDLPRLRQKLVGQPVHGNVVVVDERSSDAAIDVRVGDYLLAPSGSSSVNDAVVTEVTMPDATLLRARRAGLSGIQTAPCSAVGAIRVARANYVGRAIFRHLEDPDDV